MELFLLLVPLALAAWWRRLPLFETVFGILLLIPVVSFPLLRAVPGVWNASCFGLTAVLIFTLVAWCSRQNSHKEDARSLGANIEALAFLGFYVVCFTLTQIWPEFIAMGERLRDYALLAAVIDDPRSATEPWLAGATLNYYLYWYRFGAMVAQMLGAEVWQVYHLLQAFTTALFGATLFALARRVLKIPTLGSLLLAVVSVFGSNLAGIVSLGGDAGAWWGPSRVIPGAINEFPAWSFLLGDLHPHFLNLPLLPFLLLVAVRLAPRFSVAGALLPAALAGTSLVWCYNANAWEVPLWAIVWGGLAVIALWSYIGSRRDLILRSFASLGDMQSVMVYCLIIWSAAALFGAAFGISPGDTPVRLVTGAIGRSELTAFLSHWGIPLAGIALGVVFLAGSLIEAGLLVVALGGALCSRDALSLLVVLSGVLLIAALRRRPDSAPGIPWAITFAGLGVVLLAIPEIVFMDDPYGGENERMNTIFKVYAAAWWLVHLGAAGLVTDAVRRLPLRYVWPRRVIVVGIVLLSVAMLGFFIRTVPVRKTVSDSGVARARGLSEINRVYPGAAAAINRLTTEPRQIVLEAQGPAYSYTSHVATLAGQTSFLGWANHVNLLTRQYDEVGRRERVTKEFYLAPSCQERRVIALRERISFVVVGPLERKEYPAVASADFSCFPELIAAGEYRIFDARG